MTVKATLGFGTVFSYTPDGGGPTSLSAFGYNSLTLPPSKKFDTAPYTDVAVAAPKQLSALGQQPVTDMSGVCFYAAAAYAAISALAGTHGTFTLTANDGQVRTYTGWMTELQQGPISDTAIQVMTFTAKIDGGSETITAGLLVNTTWTMSGGTLAIDLTASPFSATGKKGMILSLLAPATNGAVVTLTVGVSNGYTGFGADMSVALDPGVPAIIYVPVTPVAVGSGAKELTLTGTTTDQLIASAVFV